MRRLLSACLACAAGLLLAARGASAQPAHAAHSMSALRELNSSVEALVRRVSPSVVQVVVTGYSPREGTDSDSAFEIVRQLTVGSGVILDPDGYIVTNAHVVAGAVRLQVVLSASSADDTPARVLGGATKTFEARIVGVVKDIDLAVLKIDASNLHALTIGDYDTVRKGDIVFALGSPGGLRDSVSMGVVSTAARQLDPDSPLVYIQTDAAINPGNSGGPLVNVDGELVGINTFILSQSGGNQGLGFAIPSAVVAAAYPKLRKYGHLQRDDIGVSVQGVTPLLASGLELPQDWGVIVADVLEGGPAERAGIQVQDIITSVDRKPTTSVPLLSMQLNTHRDPDRVVLGVLRGSEESSVDVEVVHISTDLTRLRDTLHLELKPIDMLGILAVEIDDAIGLLLPSLRIPSGLIVAARTEHWRGPALSIAAGDVIHAINGMAIRTVDGLVSALRELKARRPIVLQVERDGKLTFIAFELD
jgi:serine protease Do